MVVLFAILLIAAVAGTIESGILDQPLSRKAQAALNNAIGPRYSATVGSTAIRLTSNLQLALDAQNVSVTDQQSGRHLSTMDSVQMILDPVALAQGKLLVADVKATDIALDTALLPSGNPVDISSLRVDAIPLAIENVFVDLDMLQHFAQGDGTNTISVSGLQIKLGAAEGKPPLNLAIDNLTLRRPSQNSLELAGRLSLNGAAATLRIDATSDGNKVTSLAGRLNELDLTPLTLKHSEENEPEQGINAKADLLFTADRARSDAPPKLRMVSDIEPGTIYIDRDAQALTKAHIDLSYDYAQGAIEAKDSLLQFAATTLPFSAHVADLDRTDPSAPKGFAIQANIKQGVAAPGGVKAPPLPFEASVTGKFLSDSHSLSLDDMTVTTPSGSLLAQMQVKFLPPSPEIRFEARSDTLSTLAVEQLWPFWISARPREWAQENLFDGTLSNTVISVFIPQGRLAEAEESRKLVLDKGELHIAFDTTGMGMVVPGDIPALRDLSGHFDLDGPLMKVDVAHATSAFASGRSVALSAGTFTAASVYDNPLMANLKFNLSGNADAVGELLTYKPLDVLQRTGFKPEDFKGKVDAGIEATVGLVSQQNPPPPVWKANFQLHKVDLLKKVDGQTISDVDGTISANNQEVHLSAQAAIHGVPAKIDLTQPTDPHASAKGEQVITATLSNEQREAIAPGLSEILSGPMKVVLTKKSDTEQAVDVDLGKSSLTLPWIGWSKGVGIPAKVSFDLAGANDTFSIKNFTLKGDGFGAAGSLTIGKDGLTAADFSSVKLSATDDFGLNLKKSKGTYDVSVSGNVVDARSILAKLKSNGEGDGGKSDGASASTDAVIHAKLDKVVGFGDESLSNVSLVYATAGGHMTTADLSAVTRSGQAVISKMSKTGANPGIHLTSGDAGAVIRFANIYDHMRGGLLNLELREDGEGGWDGYADIRRFAISNDKRLKTIVTTPAGKEGESLNSAVKTDIDTTSQNFQRGFAHIRARKGTLSVENGVVRGEQIGATFQGFIKDEKGEMDLTGTFMPAYGLNRLFAEVPIVGFLLGNGSDRGLIGITFKLTGAFEKPNLVINPLSIIAPGVFRQIFEFQ